MQQKSGENVERSPSEIPAHHSHECGNCGELLTCDGNCAEFIARITDECKSFDNWI